MNNRIFTGNYEECKAGNLISISGDRGKKAGFNGKAIPELAPKRKFWKIWHSNIGKKSEEENARYYIEHYYNEVLSRVNIEKILEDEVNPILLCYEKGQAFCHRHILAEYIELMYGIKVRDIGVDENLEVTENKRPEYIRRIIKEVMLKDMER